MTGAAREDGPLVKAEGVAVGYGDHPLLEDVSFEIQRGEVFAILGPSGCGKTTLMKHAIGLVPPVAGRIEVAGEDPWADPPGGGRAGRLARRARRERAPLFGVVYQSGALFGSLTLLDNVALPLRRWTDLDASSVEALARAKLRMVGLHGAEHKLPSELSGGMRRRGGVARALALDPEILFLDEPSAGLDPISAAQLDELIRSLADALCVTVVLVTHELASIFAIAGRCVMLDGEARAAIAEGDPRELRDHSDDPRVHAFFNRAPLGKRQGED